MAEGATHAAHPSPGWAARMGACACARARARGAMVCAQAQAQWAAAGARQPRILTIQCQPLWPRWAVGRCRYAPCTHARARTHTHTHTRQQAGRPPSPPRPRRPGALRPVAPAPPAAEPAGVSRPGPARSRGPVPGEPAAAAPAGVHEHAFRVIVRAAFRSFRRQVSDNLSCDRAGASDDSESAPGPGPEPGRQAWDAALSLTHWQWASWLYLDRCDESYPSHESRQRVRRRQARGGVVVIT